MERLNFDTPESFSDDYRLEQARIQAEYAQARYEALQEELTTKDNHTIDELIEEARRLAK